MAAQTTQNKNNAPKNNNLNKHAGRGAVPFMCEEADVTLHSRPEYNKCYDAFDIE
ncbi:hypothetical protein ACNR90_000088 [Candidozyma auris]